MTIEFLRVAQLELGEAVNYYNEQSEGLGYEFAAEVQRTIGRIVQYPNAWPPSSKRTRQIRDNALLIIAVMHLRRHPDTWKSRLGPGSS